jgi:hypothetical protein
MQLITYILCRYLPLAAWVSTIGGLTNQHRVADPVAVAQACRNL